MVDDIGLHHCYDGSDVEVPPGDNIQSVFSHCAHLKLLSRGPVSRIVKYESFLIYDFLNLGTSLRRSVVAFLEALRK